MSTNPFRDESVYRENAMLSTENERLRAEVADLKRRVRLARAYVWSNFAQPDLGVSRRLGALHDLLDLRKPVPKRQNRRRATS